MRLSQKRRRPLSEINVVPYIDVMLVLLVIFMITAPLLMQGVKVQLPHTKAKVIDSTKNTPMIVSIDAQGKYYLNVSAHPNEPITPQHLMTEVAAQLLIAQKTHQEKPIYVKGDRNVDYGKVVRAMVLLQRAGAHNVGLITKT